MFEKLISWSHQNFKTLPWRKNRSLYRTLVSEIMLQQTTVGTVINHYERFLKIFPDPETLAKSTEEEILVAWKGLGYYRRAKNLRSICVDLHSKYGGEFPLSREELLSLKGVGPYTSSALLAIGLNRIELALDANLERVCSRIYGIKGKKGVPLQKKLRELFLKGKILQNQEIWGPRKLHEALMDLGRIYCQANRVECFTCPMNEECQAFKSGKPLSYPESRTPLEKKKKIEYVEMVRFIVRDKLGKILVYQKQEHQWLHGQWEIPTMIISEVKIPKDQYPKISLENLKLDVEKSQKYKTNITRYQFLNYVHEPKANEFKNFLKEIKHSVKYPNYFWKEECEIIPHLSTGSLKALQKSSVATNISADYKKQGVKR